MRRGELAWGLLEGMDMKRAAMKSAGLWVAVCLGAAASWAQGVAEPQAQPAHAAPSVSYVGQPVSPAPQAPAYATLEFVRPGDLVPLQNSLIRLQGEALDAREGAARIRERADALQRDQRQLNEGLEAVRADVQALRAMSAPQAAAPGADASWQVPLNLAWVLVCGFLVMFMQAGFAMVETGFTREKNAAHTMAMNFMVFSLGILGYWACGFALMFGGTGAAESVSTVATLGGDVGKVLSQSIGFRFGDAYFGIAGNAGYFLSGEALASGVFALFLFQAVFMDTAATIPTGTMAERWRFLPFCIYAVAVGAFIYPLYGHWVWGGGWLAALGKNFGLGHGHVDFAGSSVVHLCGAVIGLVGTLMLGPRQGKFNADGSANPIPGHNLPMAFVGTFILMFGWFGFNAGSTLAASDLQIGIIATNTMLAGAAGAATAMVTTWFKFRRPDPSFMCNGLLAGLVAITASCAFVEAWSAVLIGAVAGILVVVSAIFLEERLQVDDPVGAVSVHGACGAWGIVALGLFANGRYGAGWNGVGAEVYLGQSVKPGASGGVTGLLFGDAGQLVAQIIGTGTCVVAVGAMAFLLFGVLGVLFGNRSDPVEERAGIDIPELGTTAYPRETGLRA